MAGGSEGRDIDVSAMQKMSDQEYRQHLRDEEIMFLDGNRILRLTDRGIPMATTREQLDILIEELRQFRGQLQPKRK